MSDIYIIEVEKKERSIGEPNKLYRCESYEDAMYELEDHARNQNVKIVRVFHVVEGIYKPTHKLEIFEEK